MVRTLIRDAEDNEQHRWACFLAAIVEFLTVRGSLPTPSWVYGDKWTLFGALVSYATLEAPGLATCGYPAST